MGTSRYAFLGRVAPATTAVLIERIPGVRDVRVEVAVADLEKAMAARGSARVGTVRSGAAHPATRTFQALRIEVNNELGALEEMLSQTPDLLTPGGRLAIITFHSLEDRMVKNYLATGKVFGDQEKDFYGNVIRPFDPVNRKPVEASAEEVGQNARARSAKLRIGERRQ